MHNLTEVKNSWHCSICCWQWKSKPNTDCPGVPRYKWSDRPESLFTRYELNRENLKPLALAQPKGCFWSSNNNQWVWLYDRSSAEIDNSGLPQVYDWKKGYPPELKTEGQLRRENLRPLPEAKPRGCLPIFNKEFYEIEWLLLYHPEDCEWQSQDNYICKKTLKLAYLLSDGWIKRLGDPDLEVENKYHRRFSTVKLYSRQRVETFLADNAEEYCQWLDKRDKYLAIALKQKPARDAARAEAKKQKQLIAEQTARCLQCASSGGTHTAFLCAIHPMGIPQIPCFDFQPRKTR